MLWLILCPLMATVSFKLLILLCVLLRELTLQCAYFNATCQKLAVRNSKSLTDMLKHRFNVQRQYVLIHVLYKAVT